MCISSLLMATDELMQVKLWVCKNFSPDATKIQSADNREGSHPLRAAAPLRLSPRKGHLKCIRITSIQAPAALCIALWDLLTWTYSALEWFVASLKTAESPGSSTQLFMSWLCAGLTRALFFTARLNVKRSRPEQQARFATFTRCPSDTVLVASLLPRNPEYKTFCITANRPKGQL